MSNALINSLLPNINSILGVRDSIGAIIQDVSFIKRTWYTDNTYATPAANISGIAAKDVVTQMLPTPQIVNLSQNLNLKEGGTIKQGDIILKNVSKQSFVEANLDGSSNAANVENLYLVGQKVYQVINLVERYVTWDVQLRELTNQTRY